MYRIITLLLFGFSFAQENTEMKTTISGYLETYYSYDFNAPNTDLKLPFMYNYNRHNEFNINIGLLRAKVAYENVYVNIALQAGTYVDDNYAVEKIKYLNEAYIGINLDQDNKHNLEVGIMPSYIGFETAVSHSNLNLTRSLLAENSPYFMTGVKYNYKPTDIWNFAFLLTNGWQRINKPQKNNAPSFGSQIVYKSAANTTFNWSTFVGKEYNGIDYTMRYFSNLYFDKKWTDKWRTIAGFDFGAQDVSTTNNKAATWLSPVFIAQYAINPKWQAAVRAEYYQDKKNIIIAVNDEVKILGLSLNIDYLPNSKVKLRTEGRYLNNQKAIFAREANFVNSNLFVTTSLSFEF